MIVRRFGSDEWRSYRDLRLRALYESPDAFGSTFSHESERTDDDWQSRLGSGATSPRDLPLIAESEGKAVGLAWARIDESQPDVAHLYQVWVAPSYRRIGIGAALLASAIDWARSVGARSIALGVTCGDNPALHLYRRAGFAPAGDPKPLRPGSAVLSQPMELVLNRGSA